MKKDKKFIIDGIKMDLYRVVTGTGDIRKELDKDYARIFLEHAKKEFTRIQLNTTERKLLNELETLDKSLDYVQDPHNRLRWVENIMTIRCRL